MNHVLLTHSILRWAILIFGLSALFLSIIGLLHSKKYTNLNNKLSLFFMISYDIQLLIGLFLYFKNQWFDNLISNTAVVMKNTIDRFFTVEHAFSMILAWVLVHVGRSAIKRANLDTRKHKLTLIYFGIAMLLILAMIPWPLRQAGIARPLF